MSSKLSTPSTMKATKHTGSGWGLQQEKATCFVFFGDNGLIKF